MNKQLLTEQTGIRPIAPGAKLALFNDLKKGDSFKYLSDTSESWNIVMDSTSSGLRYKVGGTAFITICSKGLVNLHVWVKGKEAQSCNI